MYKIKLVQENPKVGDIQGNLDLAKSHITEAKEKDLDLIIFSEMFNRLSARRSAFKGRFFRRKREVFQRA